MQDNLDDIFNINTFNIYQDNDNYYFFRALNMADNDDLESGIILNNGKIIKVRTDLDRYVAEPIYTKDDEISLEQMVDHIKMQHRTDTNCISLSSNANTALDYGRNFYKDKYVIIKVPKEDLNKKVYEAGLYITKEIENKINILKENNELDQITINLLDIIDRAKNENELSIIRNTLKLNSKEQKDNRFQNGLTFKDINSSNYAALSDIQNFEKDKIVLKLAVLNRNVLEKSSNQVLIQTLGNAFSSLELIHYGEIEEKNIMEVTKEKMDVLALIQQLPKDTPYLDEIKELVIKTNIKLDTFNSENLSIDESKISIDNLYNIDSSINYRDIYNLYKDTFYLVKSRLRNNNTINNLNKILNNNPKYNEAVSYLNKNGFGIEKEIVSRDSSFKIKLSESVGLNTNNMFIYNLVKAIDLNILKQFIDPNIAIEYFIHNSVVNIKRDNYQSKEDYIINSIIDMLDWDSFNVIPNLGEKQRVDLVNKFKDSKCIEYYNELCRMGIYGSNASYIIFNNVINNTDTLILDGKFNLDELEMFIGYNKIINTNLELYPHQRRVVNSLNKLYQDHNYAAAVLPTGAGKSFVALAEMLKHREDKMLYLAPNDVIIEQLMDYIIEFFYYDEFEKKDNTKKKKVKKVFPNLEITTYQNLRDQDNNLKDEFNKTYKFIVFDELHRTGAPEWMEDTKKIVANQDENTNIIGITATPERDIDSKNMADLWAKNPGNDKFKSYNEKELRAKKFIANGSMSLPDAIRKGIVPNPKFVNCEYALLHDGLDGIQEKIDMVFDPEKKAEYQQRLDALRKNVIHGMGIEEILHDNLNPGDKFIVFLPKNNSNNENYIKDYQDLFRQYIYSYEYLNNHKKINDIYEKILLKEKLTSDEELYLNDEKDNILLLASFKMNGSLDEENGLDTKSLSLITKTNDIAQVLIDYKKFEYLSKADQVKKLKELTEGKIETYSLYSGSGKSKNRNKNKNKEQLNAFNDDKNQSSKFKALFVIDMLNEGAHLKNVNKMVWLRPLSENSNIMFHQQLGRIIKTIKKGQKIKDSDRPIVLDLVNNLWRVNIQKNQLQEEIDLNTLQNCILWISDNGYPSVNSNNKEELDVLKSLYFICNRYLKYVNDANLLKEVSIDRGYLIEEIINTGYSIDLWTMETCLIKKKYEIKHKESIKEKDEMDYLLELNPIMKDFVDLDNDTKKYSIYNRNQLTEIYIEYLLSEDKSKSKRRGHINKDDQTPIGNTTMNKYFEREQQFIKVLLSKENRTKEELNRIDCYNRIMLIKEKIAIEERKQLTEKCIAYLLSEDKSKSKRRGYINKGDQTTIGNTTMWDYIHNEQKFVKGMLLKENKTQIEQNRIECYNKILYIQEQVRIEEKIMQRKKLTEKYIAYLLSADKSKNKRRGYINKDDQTPIANTTMWEYIHNEQKFVKGMLLKENKTQIEQNRIDCYNKILNIQEQVRIEEEIIERKQITEKYIAYLLSADKSKNKRRGYINKDDQTPIVNTTMGRYLYYESSVIKKLLTKEIKTQTEQNRMECYNRILAIKEQIKLESKRNYSKVKEEFDESSEFSKLKSKMEVNSVAR